MLIDELLVNGFPLENRARVIEVWDGARSVVARRYTNVIVPNRDGELWLPKARQAKLFMVGMAILDCDPLTGTIPGTEAGRRAQFNQNWRDFVRLVGDDTKPLTLGRTVSYPAGRIERQTAQGEVEGPIEPMMISASTCRVAFTFKLLDGIWFGEWSDTTDRLDDGPSSRLGAEVGKLALDAPGDATTWKIEVHMSGGKGQRLTNTTTGDWVQFGGDTTAVPVVLDVPTFTATQGQNNVISQVTSGDTQVSPYWMTLRPGPNQLEISGGGLIQVRYKGAHG